MESQADMPGNSMVAIFKLFITCYGCMGGLL